MTTIDMSSALGLGLGLPSTFNTNAKRSPSSRTVTNARSIRSSSRYATPAADCCFPMPSTSTSTSPRLVSIRPDLVSYWSPDSSFCGDDEESSLDEINAYSPVEFGQSQMIYEEETFSMAIRPRPEVHMTDTIEMGLSPSEAVIEALEYAWLVPLVDAATVEAKPHTLAPIMTSYPSIISELSSQSLQSYSSGMSFSESDYSPNSMASSPQQQASHPNQRQMFQSQSAISAVSAISTSSASTSICSMLDRKRPVTSSFAKPSASASPVVRLRAASSYKARAAKKEADNSAVEPINDVSAYVAMAHEFHSVADVIVEEAEDSGCDPSPPYTPVSANYDLNRSLPRLPQHDISQAEARKFSIGKVSLCATKSTSPVVPPPRSSSLHTLAFQDPPVSGKFNDWLVAGRPKSDCAQQMCAREMHKHSQISKAERIVSWVDGVQAHDVTRPAQSRPRPSKRLPAKPAKMTDCFEPGRTMQLKKKASIEQMLNNGPDPIWSFLG